MKIIVDAFGGDNAPLEIIKGCVLSVSEFDDLQIILTGSKNVIEKTAAENSLSLDKIEIEDCDEIITMEDSAETVLKTKKNSSMAVGFRLLNEGRGEAFVTAGNSGALCMGATLSVKRIKGIKRPAFAPVMPAASGCFMLADAGANLECRPEMLYQFALMSSIYMSRVMKTENPRIGLVNVGSEEHKGTELYQTVYKMLAESDLNFIGNVEGRDLPKGVCDVAVCDGFTGNLVLKTYEGVAEVLMKEIKSMFSGSTRGKLSAVMLTKELKGMKKRFDYNEYGGAAIIGSSKPVFKAHGSAKAKTVKNAVRLSRDYVNADAIGEISRAIRQGER